MGSPVAPRPTDLPEGFELDPELPEGFTLDEPADLSSPNQPVQGHPAQQLASGMVRGGLNAINPVNLAKALWELGKFGVKGALKPTSITGDIANLGRGLYETGAAALGQRGPEAAGEVYGGALAGGLPVGGAGARMARAAGATEASRAHNLTRALRATERQIPALEKASAEIDLPVVARHRTLAAKLAERKAGTGAAVGAAEAALPPTNISTADVVARMEPPTGQWVSGPQGVMEFVPDDPQAFAAFQASVGRLESAGPLTAQDALRIKRAEQAIAERGKAYDRTLPGEEAAVSAGVARAKGKALRQTLEAIPGPESEALTEANRAHYLASIVEKPAARELLRMKKQGLAQRGAEILLGRAGAGSRTSLGALAGLAGGQLLDSTLFHTASAAIKRRVIDALQSGQPQLATDILFKAAVAEDATRRRAAEALKAQGEGVTAP